MQPSTLSPPSSPSTTQRHCARHDCPRQVVAPRSSEPLCAMVGGRRHAPSPRRIRPPKLTSATWRSRVKLADVQNACGTARPTLLLSAVLESLGLVFRECRCSLHAHLLAVY
ncbi:hypothetical protein GY45DRAFT_22240 [Cubamyces sp. BRFM 1775]|nr:hypothetical protein GY45DRAFT_22240 [Cubamyces sp. BRFM 1775]